ncbi:hypothetical protein [Streptomyces sp. NPDC002520]
MSSGLTVYLLDVARTRALVGSGDEELLQVDGVMQCLGWMRHAEARPGFGLIGFVS